MKPYRFALGGIIAAICLYGLIGIFVMKIVWPWLRDILAANGVKGL